MPTQAEIRQTITEKIVAALRSGTVPFWRRPWTQSENAGFPTDVVSGKKYQGINTWLTALAALEKGYDSKWWGTYQQWRSLGGQVRRGEKGTQIILYKPIRKITVNDEGEEAVDTFPIMRTWTVFNVAQVDSDSLDQYRATVRIAPDSRFVDCGPAEETIAATGADIRHGGSRAAYLPEPDYIQLPPKAAFGKPHEYYGVAGHELVHWTGHKSRLNRLNRLARFGDKSYAMEELVAELGSAFLLAELGIPQSDDLSNVTAYLADWLKVLENDHYAVFTASSAASKAVEFITGFSRKADTAEESEEAGELVTAE
jgi:antirestriction protein ArdC